MCLIFCLPASSKSTIVREKKTPDYAIINPSSSRQKKDNIQKDGTEIGQSESPGKSSIQNDKEREERQTYINKRGKNDVGHVIFINSHQATLRQEIPIKVFLFCFILSTKEHKK